MCVGDCVGDPARLVICSGCTEALRLLAEVPGEAGVTTAGMEDPTIADRVRALTPYLGVADVPLDGEGLRIDVLRNSGAEVVMCTPAHQFPVGRRGSCTPARRARPSALQTSAVDQLALCRMLESGDYDAYLRSVRRTYHRRRDLLVDIVRSTCRRPGSRASPPACTPSSNSHPGWDEATTTDRLHKASIGVHPLTGYLRSAGYPPSLVLGYAAESDDAYPAALVAFLRSPDRHVDQ